jgi:hypothetical protein
MKTKQKKKSIYCKKREKKRRGADYVHVSLSVVIFTRPIGRIHALLHLSMEIRTSSGHCTNVFGRAQANININIVNLFELV